MRFTNTHATAIGAIALLFASAPLAGATTDLSLCRSLAKNVYRADKLQCLSLAKSGQSGTTLAASKTIDICDNGNGTWTYSGEVSIWNEGAIDTLGCSISDTVESKNTSGPNWTSIGSQVLSCAEIPAGTTQATALTFKYSITAPPSATTDIRNRAKVTILNHSGSVGKAFGPEPKATYSGVLPPLPCVKECGCTFTIGYWGAKPGTEWPPDYDRAALFYLSPYSWGDILPPVNAGPNSSGYYQLARQYIGAVLNREAGACVPDGIASLLAQAETFFLATAPASCGTNGCALQKTWAGTLDDYNNGVYQGGPAHCD